MRYLSRLSHALLVISSLTGCDFDPLSNLEDPTLSNLRVGPGVTPTFSWSGSKASHVIVRRVIDGETVWHVRDDGGMPSPITYAVPPSDAQELVRLQATLTEGVAYTVAVTALCLFCEPGVTAYRTFTP